MKNVVNMATGLFESPVFMLPVITANEKSLGAQGILCQSWVEGTGIYSVEDCLLLIQYTVQFETV